MALDAMRKAQASYEVREPIEMRMTKVRSRFETAAAKAGAIDPGAAYKLANTASLKVQDEGGIEGIDQALAKLRKSGPYPSTSNPVSSRIACSSRPRSRKWSEWMPLRCPRTPPVSFIQLSTVAATVGVVRGRSTGRACNSSSVNLSGRTRNTTCSTSTP